MTDSSTNTPTDTPQGNVPVALSHSRHKGLKLKPGTSLDHIRRSHFARIGITEFSDAGIDTPIIFIKSPQGDVIAVAMWGFEAGENLVVDGDTWLCNYQPAFVRAHPFAIIPDQEKPDHFYIGLFENSMFVSQEEGELILDDNGERTQLMQEIESFLARIYNDQKATSEFTKKLGDLGLFSEQSVKLKDPVTGEDKETGAFYIVDQEKLEQLSDEQFLELRNNGWLLAIYIHLLSLKLIDRLARRKSERAGAEIQPGNA